LAIAIDGAPGPPALVIAWGWPLAFMPALNPAFIAAKSTLKLANQTEPKGDAPSATTTAVLPITSQLATPLVGNAVAGVPRIMSPPPLLAVAPEVLRTTCQMPPKYSPFVPPGENERALMHRGEHSGTATAKGAMP
jgi:hypothetical protein